MLVRFVIDVAKGKMELSETPSASPARPSVLDVHVNRFIPADFVFRCRVVSQQVLFPSRDR
jgi:hypothetical protein